MNYIIGIDIGTTNTKAVGYNYTGGVLAKSNKTYNHLSPREGYHELDPVVLFNSVLNVIRQVTDACSTHELTAICFSSAMHGLFAVDQLGEPLTNMITWADLRSSAYARQLKYSAEGDFIYQRTGTPIHAMSPLCKLMWMKHHLPEVFNNAHKFISIKEFIFHRFFNTYLVDRSIASSTGLFDVHNLDWCPEAMKTASIDASRLSTHVASTEIVRGLNIAYASQLNVPPDTPFMIGGSDGCMAHIGSNALAKGDVSLTIGTSGAVRVLIEKPVVDQQQRVFNYLITDHMYLSGGPVNNGGNVLQWFAKAFLKKNFKVTDDFDGFIDEALQTPAGANGLVFLPYIYGERAPVWDADARGIFFGVSAFHEMSHFMRAVMEGVSYALLDILQSIEEVIGPVNNIYVSGGFIRSRKWVMLLADVFGRKLIVNHAEDSSAAGSVILGMKTLGLIKDWGEASGFFRAEEDYLPGLEDHDVYMRNFAVYSNLYDKFREIKN